MPESRSRVTTLDQASWRLARAGRVEARPTVFIGYKTIIRGRVLDPDEFIELRDILAACRRKDETAERPTS